MNLSPECRALVLYICYSWLVFKKKIYIYIENVLNVLDLNKNKNIDENK
jgi:hypothetical protein